MILLVCLLFTGLVAACGAAAIAPAPSLPHTASPARPAEPTDTPVSPATISSSSTPVSTETALPGVEPTEQLAEVPFVTPETVVGLVVTVGGTAFPVELAITVAQQVQGLSDRPILAPGTGMLFVYEQPSKLTFWMTDMHFPLDMVWIGADCAVVDVTLNAPPPEPGQTSDQLPRFSSGAPAQYVLEINAGEADSGSIAPGDPVEFTGSLAGRYGC